MASRFLHYPGHGAGGHYGGEMNQRDLLKLAKRYFIADAGLSVENLVRKIQLAEGNFDCFATGKSNCDEATCRWRKDCLSESAQYAQVHS